MLSRVIVSCVLFLTVPVSAAVHYDFPSLSLPLPHHIITLLKVFSHEAGQLYNTQG